VGHVKGAAPRPAVRCWCAAGGRAAEAHVLETIGTYVGGARAGSRAPDLALPLAGCDATGPRGDGARHAGVAAEEHLEHLECGALIAADCLLP
jgi:hypothetical protein